MKLKKSRKDLLEIQKKLAGVKGLTGFKVCYAVDKSADMLAGSVLKEVKIAEKQLKEYREAINTIPKEKDRNIEGARISKKFKKVIDEYEQFIEEEIEVEVHGLELSIVEGNEDGLPITIDQMRAVRPLLES